MCGPARWSGRRGRSRTSRSGALVWRAAGRADRDRRHPLISREEGDLDAVDTADAREGLIGAFLVHSTSE
jgi:hypothetical protein